MPDPHVRVPPGPTATERATAAAVHVFTACGAVLGWLALRAAIDGDLRLSFLWMMAATAIDAIDGWFARAARVRDVLPAVDGARLDDVVDYVTYVFVPAVVVWRAGVLPDAWGVPVAGAMLVSSAFGFSRTDAKTDDFFFTGFPSYWNIVVFYLAAGGLPGLANVGILLALAALVFVPIGYVYPSRTPVLQRLTFALGTAWAAMVVVLAWRWPEIDRTWLVVSLAYPVYYVALSLALHRSRAPARRV